MRKATAKRKGFVIVAVAVALVGLIAALGLAYDLGRVYIARSEAQNFTDAAAIAATLELDGTNAGITRARARVASDLNRWNFGQDTFQNPFTEFAQASVGPWEANPGNPARFRYARVSVNVPVPLTFLPIIETQPAVPVQGAAFLMLRIGSTLNVEADSDAGQHLTISYKEGLLPFSPYAHNPNEPVHAGLLVGQLYTLRWASNFNANGNNDANMCPGDRTDAMRTLVQSGSASDRGYIEETSASVIRNAILYDYQTIFRTIGDSVTMTGGTKQTQRDALAERVRQDTDRYSETYTDYMTLNQGNGRRLVGVPINSGAPDFRIVQIGAFFLSTAETYESAMGGNKPFCAEYVGAWVKGSKNKGAEEGGSHTLKLMR